MPTRKIALIGFGIIGTGVVKILQQKRAFLKQKTGMDIQLHTICDLDITTSRGVKTDGIQLTTDVNDIFSNDEIEVVIELIGGYEPARSFTLKALDAGKDVVTANKALIAVHGAELFAHAASCGRTIGFEASTGGCIPVLRSMRESFTVNHYNYIVGIVNGTCNYILTEMTQKGLDFQTALKQAQELGFAEADPTFDIEGVDSAHKASILASMAYGRIIPFEKIFHEGITAISADDIAFASELGYTIKLIAYIQKVGDAIDIRVHPAMIPSTAEIAGVGGALNAVQIDGDMIGHSLLVGNGAGSLPTASAVLGDVIEILGDRSRSSEKGHFPAPLGFTSGSLSEGAVVPLGEVSGEYYMKCSLIDKPMVLSQLTGILGRHQISIASVYQKEQDKGEYVPVVIMTHVSTEQNLQNALKEIKEAPYCKMVNIIRIFDQL